jgi:hypothetical protein
MRGVAWAKQSLSLGLSGAKRSFGLRHQPRGDNRHCRSGYGNHTDRRHGLQLSRSGSGGDSRGTAESGSVTIMSTAVITIQ